MLVRHEPRCGKVQRVSRGWTLKRGGGLSRAKAVNEVDAARDRATREEEEVSRREECLFKAKPVNEMDAAREHVTQTFCHTFQRLRTRLTRRHSTGHNKLSSKVQDFWKMSLYYPSTRGDERVCVCVCWRNFSPIKHQATPFYIIS